MKTFFEQIPDEIEESAKVEGCSTLRIFFKIIIPLSKPIIATICIFVGVDQWNSWFDAFLYITNETLYPLQTYLYKVLAYAQSQEQFGIANSLSERMGASLMTIKSATVIVTTLPIIFIFSFFNKYFQQGIMVGAIKG